MLFEDRIEAGRQLGKEIVSYNFFLPLVVGIPRGGVPVAYEVARKLSCPLGCLIVRKIGIPGAPEFGVGAIAGESTIVYDEPTMSSLGISEEDLLPIVKRERIELQRRKEKYGIDNTYSFSPETVIIVDDGLATGNSIKAALYETSQQYPNARIVVAIPVAAPETVELLEEIEEVGLVVALSTPSYFMAVGAWYKNFEQTTDEEVITCLEERNKEYSSNMT